MFLASNMRWLNTSPTFFLFFSFLRGGYGMRTGCLSHRCVIMAVALFPLKPPDRSWALQSQTSSTSRAMFSAGGKRSQHHLKLAVLSVRYYSLCAYKESLHLESCLNQTNSIYTGVTWKHFTLCSVAPGHCSLNNCFYVNIKMRLPKLSRHPQSHQTASGSQTNNTFTLWHKIWRPWLKFVWSAVYFVTPLFFPPKYG